MAFSGDSIFWVEVEKIVPNPFQPRRDFDEAKLTELAESVRMYGILQPLTVTRREVHREDGTFYTEYELIAGERRLRASRLAGLLQVPVIIREGEDSEQEKLELAIIENLQREDLNAVDRAMAFKQLADQFGLSHSQIGKKVGRSRMYVSNSLRLLALPEYMLDSVKTGELSEGHARTLLMLSDKPEEMDTVYREILLKKISVREVERIARKVAVDRVRKPNLADIDPSLAEFERQLTESLGTRVQIDKTDYGGRVTIDYFSVDDLEQMLSRLRTDTSESVAAESEQQPTDVSEDVKRAVAALVGQTPLRESPAATEETADISAPTADTTVNATEYGHESSVFDPTPVAQDDQPADAPQHLSEPVTPFVDSDVPASSFAESPAEHEPATPVPAPIRVRIFISEAVSYISEEPTFVPESAAEEVTTPAASQFEPASDNNAVDTPVDPSPAPSSEDESNLYAIRNFSL